ncbi:MAG: PQQ-dependent sugar dehydrogenase [Cyanothece sp. SIO2G6]|nr:PQQ-dependent sugar dehydrogenase [Cyanothece sp. SIO2G6]
MSTGLSLGQTLSLVMISALMAGCAQPKSSTPVDSTLAPIPAASQTVETAQTPDPSPPATAVTIQSQVVLSNLEHPWGMAWLPDGDLLITERSGRLRLVRDGQLAPDPIAGLPAIFAQGQGGLLDITLHPNFEQEPWVYLSYSGGDRNANHTRIFRAQWQSGQLVNGEIIFEVTQLKSGTQHFGSRFVWLPDQTLLIAIGDGGNPPVRLDGELIRQNAQNLNSRLGKVVRINPDGSIPADNPFVNDARVDPTIWSYGHRNIQGLAYDPVGDRIWASEHGARGGDELNLLEPGQNYGWPLVTHSREYTGGEISPDRSRPGMVDPLVVWTPAIAPSGLTVYRGDQIPQWQGNVFAGGLVSRAIQRFELDEAGNITGQDSIAIGQRVRDVRQGPDGLIYVLTDEDNGQLLRLGPANQS